MSASFEDCLQPIYDHAYRYCVTLCGNVVDAEDVLQEALMKALERFSQLRDPKAFKSWLFRIIATTTTDRYRRSRRLVMVEDPDTVDVRQETQSKTELSIDLMRALDTLGERERECLMLYELGGLSISEIMDVQGAESASAIKSRLKRARERLRESLHLRNHLPESSSPVELEVERA